jgi:hypothetical protein
MAREQKRTAKLALTRPIELAVPDEIRTDELSQPVEQLAAKRVRASNGLSIAEETECRQENLPR